MQSGISEAEAKEFHKLFMLSFIIFTIVAIVAHILVWNWRPWLPDEGGYGTTAAIEQGVQSAAANAVVATQG